MIGLTAEQMGVLASKTHKIELESTDIDLIYAASTLNPEEINLAKTHFSLKRFENLKTKVNNALQDKFTTGEDVDELTLSIIAILLECLTNFDFKEQLEKSVGKETLEVSFKNVRDYLEPYMKR